MQEYCAIKKSIPLSFLAFLIIIFVFLKNAWVTEDAYIIFRSLEQLFAGNGPIWNPHERVQVFTSPLWFFVLALARNFSENVYLNTIVVSLILLVLTVFTLKKLFRNSMLLLASVLFLIASNGFFDFTSSGLENVLAYFIIAIYLFNYHLFFSSIKTDTVRNNQAKLNLASLILSFGLLICVRHDLGVLMLPPTIYAILKNRTYFSLRQWLLIGVITFAPFFLYTSFSLIYYGFPFPNTAYAKLNTGIDRIVLIRQGIYYLYSSLKFDLITLIVIFIAALFSIFGFAEKHLKYFSYGIILHLFYVVCVGGDFMQGRFISYAYFVSVCSLLLIVNKYDLRIYKSFSVMIVVLYLIFYTHTPLNSPSNYSNVSIYEGIADERGFYFNKVSLLSYIVRNKRLMYFPDHSDSKMGYEQQGTGALIMTRHIGFLGYNAGTDTVIIDHNALSDPLLARLPVTGWWRIGHFDRSLPEGYVESIIQGKEIIKDPYLNEYYKKLKIVTQSEELFTLERLKNILLFNIGVYQPPNDLPKH